MYEVPIGKWEYGDIIMKFLITKRPERPFGVEESEESRHSTLAHLEAHAL